MNEDQATIFLSYTSSDRGRVVEYYDYLTERGLLLWMDIKAIKPGQNWDFEIKKALGRSSIIIIFVSENSVNKRGYVQKELKFALDRYSEKLTDDIYIIPVMLDDHVVFPEELKGVQYTQASNDNCKQQIIDAISSQIEKLSSATIEIQQKAHLRWGFDNYIDQWDGLPGYRTEISFLRLQSTEYSNVYDINDIIKGRILQLALSARHAKFEIDIERYNYGQDRERRTNSLEAQCGEPALQGKIFSVLYSVHTYNSGAAHPNTNFISFCFLLDPVLAITGLEEFFVDSAAALALIQLEARKQLLAKAVPVDAQPEDGSESNHLDEDVLDYQLDQDWVEGGTTDWESFRCFVIRHNVIEIIFPAYQVASYADGPKFVKIEVKLLLHLIKEHFKCAMDVEYLHYNHLISQ